MLVCLHVVLVLVLICLILKRIKLLEQLVLNAILNLTTLTNVLDIADSGVKVKYFQLLKPDCLDLFSLQRAIIEVRLLRLLIRVLFFIVLFYLIVCVLI